MSLTYSQALRKSHPFDILEVPNPKVTSSHLGNSVVFPLSGVDLDFSNSWRKPTANNSIDNARCANFSLYLLCSQLLAYIAFQVLMCYKSEKHFKACLVKSANFATESKPKINHTLVHYLDTSFKAPFREVAWTTLFHHFMPSIKAWLHNLLGPTAKWKCETPCSKSRGKVQ